MPIVNPNFSEAYQPLAPGTHRCRIMSSEFKQGQQKGTHYVKWELKTEEGGHTVYYGTPIEGRGAGMFKHFVHAAGDEKYENGAYDTDVLVGRFVLCEIDQESYFHQGQERMRPKVKEVWKVGPLDDKPMEEDIQF